MILFEGEILLLRDTVTMLRSGDVIPRGSASFLCIIIMFLFQLYYSSTREKDITF